MKSLRMRGELATGYYGVPGKVAVGKVHVVSKSGPICGTKIGEASEFQWCANGVVRSYVECARCEAKLSQVATCPYCKEDLLLNDGVFPCHDHPKPCRRLCSGTHKTPEETIVERKANK